MRCLPDRRARPVLQWYGTRGECSIKEGTKKGSPDSKCSSAITVADKEGIFSKPLHLTDLPLVLPLGSIAYV